MEELKQLNNLCGKLEIENLDEVGSEEEAVGAHLELKRCLTDLWFRYSDNKKPNQSTVSHVVLQALCPHFNLNKFQAGWDSPRFDLFGSMHGFPKLESISFRMMEEWEEWEPLVDRGKGNNNAVAAVDDDDGGGVLGGERIFTYPCLRKFKISNCPKLRSLPPIFGGWLQDVAIGGLMDWSNWEWCFPINNVESLSCGSAEWLNRLPNLPNLQSLTIEGDQVVSELSNSLLEFSSLQTLATNDCENLKSLPEEMGSLKQLRELVIWDCPFLEESSGTNGVDDWIATLGTNGVEAAESARFACCNDGG